jgi:hypothetical protein
MVLAVGLLSTAGLQAAKSAPRMIPDNFSTLAEQVGPAVVNTRVEKAADAAGMGRRRRHGSMNLGRPSCIGSRPDSVSSG